MTQVNKQRPKTPKHASSCCATLDELLDADLFKALGDPTRLKLLSCLARCARACSVTEVAECCDVDFSVISRHLALLADAGILSANKEGRTVFYEVRYRDFAKQLKALAKELEACCH